ncbi:glycoside hydrolase family 16 protein [Neolentinus lepideus HHB14362 ss-1]|uniref:Glycoside hydrolase family 16 protein n=1 Tax=Neolentinus lepideus HHB14362 ss-1 TaxID=1314782 RepID=A0A165Q9J0_9AGAM|nr:glycoside hydrolase family 16 protein [Neolentinus lepideus HHB14362 ss-1]
MHLSFSLILLSVSLLTSPEAASANLLKRAHEAALRHSKGLARDLRIALKGIGQPAGALLIPRDVSPAIDAVVQKVFCVSSSKGGSGGLDGNGSVSSAPSATIGVPASTATPSASSNWKLIQSYQGQSFFDGWNFWDTSDPTNGIVDYLSQSDAMSRGLASVSSSGTALMKVDTTNNLSSTTNRASVRITTQASWTLGLVIMDAIHMPTGCGTWPAFWSNGPNWPAGGEIDVVEGVNDYTNNQATIHTNPGCTIPSLTTVPVNTAASNTTIQGASLDITGSLVATTNCAAAETQNAGCGIRANTNNSFGTGFNAIGGGVYAMHWTSDLISVYFFPRSSIPSDIAAGNPDPTSLAWGTPMALWPGTSCNMTEFFYSNVAIFDTTLCGDWAGGVWNDAGIPGQEQSCAQRTGYSTCEAFVRAEGSAFEQAYWEVNYVKIYQEKNQTSP